MFFRLFFWSYFGIAEFGALEFATRETAISVKLDFHFGLLQLGGVIEWETDIFYCQTTVEPLLFVECFDFEDIAHIVGVI